jgi:uncharacterized protein (DUF1810 family)
MWFIFPQIKGLGTSDESYYFGLDSVASAGRYLQHEVLGLRLRECTQLVLGLRNRTAGQIFGDQDCTKFRSCMTLFSLCSPPDPLFQQAIDKYFAGVWDRETLARSRSTKLEAELSDGDP